MQTERVIGIYLTLVALATAAQAVIYPAYGYEPDGTAASGAAAVWHVINWFLALGLAAMLYTTYREKRRLDARHRPTSAGGWERASSSMPRSL